MAALLVVAFAAGAAFDRLSPLNGGSSAAQPPPGAALSELGASVNEWDEHHERDVGSGARAGFLPRNADGRDRFLTAGLLHKRVSAVILQFDAHAVDEAGAKLVARAELPPDAAPVLEDRKYATSSDVDDQCYYQQYRSRTLAAVFPRDDPTGAVSVVVWSPDPQGNVQPYDARSITAINLTAGGVLGQVPEEC
jgi:hypothetical protein